MSENNIGQEELHEIFSYLIGMPVKEAINIVGHNMALRVLIKDGKELPSDTFYKDYRLNVEVKDKHIYRILSIG